MTRAEILQMLQYYVGEVNRATIMRGGVPTERRKRLVQMGASVIRAVDTWTPSASAAREARKLKAAITNDTEPFTFTWRATGEVEEVVGWQEAAARAGIAVSTLRTRMSIGQGTYPRTMMTATGSPDVAIIRRTHWRPGIGRPRREPTE